MSHPFPELEAAQSVDPIFDPTPTGTRLERGRPYLRRYSVQPGRSRLGYHLLALLLLGGLLFARVWESTVANSLSMERDRLRREVRALENRVRLSSELSDQAALREGVNAGTLHTQGFLAPDPSQIIDIDLDQAIPRAVSRGSVVAWFRRVTQGPPVGRGSDVEAVPVRARVGR